MLGNARFELRLLDSLDRLMIQLGKSRAFYTLLARLAHHPPRPAPAAPARFSLVNFFSFPYRRRRTSAHVSSSSSCLVLPFSLFFLAVPRSPGPQWKEAPAHCARCTGKVQVGGRGGLFTRRPSSKEQKQKDHSSRIHTHTAYAFLGIS